MEEVKISDYKKIVIQKRRFRRFDNIDIRTYISTAKYTGPTRKGVNIPIDKAKEFVEKLNKVIEGEPEKEEQE